MRHKGAEPAALRGKRRAVPRLRIVVGKTSFSDQAKFSSCRQSKRTGSISAAGRETRHV